MRVVDNVLIRGMKFVAIIDVDCAETDGFDETDEQGLQRLAELIGKSCDWDS